MPREARTSERAHWQVLVAYVGLLLTAAVFYLLIRAYGDSLSVSRQPYVMIVGAGSAAAHMSGFVQVLLALALVIAVARALGSLFRRFHQPAVVGEMVAGIVLGPSVLGHVAPAFAAQILPQSIAPLLNVVSQFGVILYMFLVGLELDLGSLRHYGGSVLIISHASIVVPFVLGSGLALFLYPDLASGTASFTSFSLFLGVSMSITAFPVLARILTDCGMHKSNLGILAIACAAIDDVSAWCLLAVVVAVSQTRSGGATLTLALAAMYVISMIVLVRPLVVRMSSWIGNKQRVSQTALAFVLLTILLSSLLTETIGIHAIFGAFAVGAVIPHDSFLARDLAAKLEDFVIVFLLPAFFAFTGLRTQVGLLNGGHEWLLCALTILIASLGKFGGGAVAAKLNGFDWRHASALGVLLNTRGLMELIVLNVGLELNVISPVLFTMLVIMALVTTFLTTPILHWIVPEHPMEPETSMVAGLNNLLHGD
ncbi:MAG: cation:proton antiporter [Acidobacteriaceae bacterium]|nr:cation:proton antiporter [Acidobacteriaceae bacterium]